MRPARSAACSRSKPRALSAGDAASLLPPAADAKCPLAVAPTARALRRRPRAEEHATEHTAPTLRRESTCSHRSAGSMLQGPRSRFVSGGGGGRHNVTEPAPALVALSREKKGADGPLVAHAGFADNGAAFA